MAHTKDEEDWRGLLLPLADAQDALARLEATAAIASDAVRDGLVARLSLHEAAGWLAHHGSAWVDATDLALREAALVGSWGLARRAEQLAREMPATAAAAGDDGLLDLPPLDDRQVAHALLLARRWRELAQPASSLLGGGDPGRDGLREALGSLGGGDPAGGDAWQGWLAAVGDAEGLPALLHAARLARAWQQERGAWEAGTGLLSPAALFLAVAVWRGRSADALPLPLWSAPASLLHALALKQAGEGWTAGLLGIAAAGARRALAELRRLQELECQGLALVAAATARSRLRAALDAALSLPVLTPRMLAARLGVSTRAGLALAGQLEGGGVLREVTGRGAWRAYALAPG